MRRKLSVVLLIVLASGFAFFGILRYYATELVHLAVENAVLQKAPEDYPSERIREAFSRRLEKAQRLGARDAYLLELKAISLRLEKIQYLKEAEVDELIVNLGER